MLEQRGGRPPGHWLEERVMLVRAEHRPVEERDVLIQHRRIARAGNVGRRGEGQPDAIVGDARAHALPGVRQPPMLDIAFGKLPGRRAQQVLARGRRPGEGERHGVLQLIAKAIGAARLVEGRARPDAAGQRLVQQPAVKHDVHRPVRRPDLHGAKQASPVPRHGIEHGVEIGRAITGNQRPRRLG